MIISKKHNFIFVHIPKNAGTTVETVLARFIDDDADFHVSREAIGTKNYDSVGIPPDTKIGKHMTAPQIWRALGRKAYNGYFSFAICRNPYSRCLSAFSFIKQKAKSIERGKVDLRPDQKSIRDYIDMSFDDFCKDIPGAGKYLRLFRPQVTWLPKPNSVTYVARIESLAEGMTEIFARTGLDPAGPGPLPARNQKTKSDDWRAMSPACAAAIRDYYAADFERFGYDTAFPSAKPAAAETAEASA